eukprot:Awhi_evm1s5794
MMWVEVKLGNMKNYFGIVYVPVIGTERLWREDIMDELKVIKDNLDSKGNVWILGNFNARDGKRDDLCGSDTINVLGEEKKNKEGKDRMRICNNTDDEEIEFTRYDNGEVNAK